MSKFLYYHLQTTVKETPSYVKDTVYFIQKLDQIEAVPGEFTCHIKEAYHKDSIYSNRLTT